MLQKYQLFEYLKADNNAGLKATEDVQKIADSLGYGVIALRTITDELSVWGKLLRQMGYQSDMQRACRQITSNSIVLIQSPFRQKQLLRYRYLKRLKQKKHVHIISIVHDVEKLRGGDEQKYYEYEFNMIMPLMDVIIVHNEQMKKWFIESGYSAERIVPLGVFDYLCSPKTYVCTAKENYKKVIIAGNLNANKSGYLQKISAISNTTFDLYGSNFNVSDSPNLIYHGSVAPDELPKQLNTGFGLVWDGDSIDTCDGNTGRYLMFNNPHKLSLYLVSGLPVFIWSHSAEAPFVVKYQLGYTIDSLKQIPVILQDLEFSDYVKLKQNAAVVAAKLQKGYFTNTAIMQAESIIARKP